MLLSGVVKLPYTAVMRFLVRYTLKTSVIFVNAVNLYYFCHDIREYILKNCCSDAVA